MKLLLVVFHVLLLSVHLSIGCDDDGGLEELTHAFESLFGLSNAVVSVSQMCLTATTVPERRCFYTIVPSCARSSSHDDDSQPRVPLLVNIPDKESCPLDNLRVSKWATKAIEECFVLVLPSVIGRGATTDEDENNDLLPNNNKIEGQVEDTMPSAITRDHSSFKTEDDLAFLRAMIEEVVVQKDVHIDSTRIYVTGHSTGCMSSLAMAAAHSDLVAAVCCHAGTLPTDFETVEQSYYEPVPIWMVHGELDSVVPYNGRTDGMDNLMLPVVETFHYLADRNGCDDHIVETTTVPDGTSLKRSFNCVNGANVELVTLPRSGHFPFLHADMEVGTNTAADTTAWAWDFCSSHSKTEVPARVTMPLVSLSKAQEEVMMFAANSRALQEESTAPTATAAPSAPTVSASPSSSPVPSAVPTSSHAPTLSSSPSVDDGGGGAPTQEPAEGAPTQEPAAGAPTQEPAAGGPTQEPGPGTPTQEPGPGTPTQEPGPGTPTQEPAEGTPTQEPGAGAPTKEPAGAPTKEPAGAPTKEPAAEAPTKEPGAGAPTKEPGAGAPTKEPGAGAPTKEPAENSPTQAAQPTTTPTVASQPTVQPSVANESAPTTSPAITPSVAPAKEPTTDGAPTMETTFLPTTTQEPTSSGASPVASPVMPTPTGTPPPAADPPPTPAVTAIPTPSGLPPAIPLVIPVKSCTSSDPCERCEGDCDSDSQCKGTLVCFQKEAGAANVDAVGGCIGDDESRTDWCTLPEFVGREDTFPPAAPPPTMPPQSSPNLPAAIPLVKPVRELVCFEKDQGAANVDAVGGCIGDDESRTDWCTLPEFVGRDDVVYPAPTPTTSMPVPYDPPTSGDQPSPSSNEIPLVRPIRNCTESNKCQLCEGDCDKDAQCEGPLVCFQRDRGIRGQQAVPGCRGHDLSRTDYCALSLSRNNNGGLLDMLFLRNKESQPERDVEAN